MHEVGTVATDYPGPYLVIAGAYIYILSNGYTIASTTRELGFTAGGFLYRDPSLQSED